VVSTKLEIRASDGTMLSGRFFCPDSPKSVMLIVHGLGEHSGRYRHVAEYFVDLGEAVLIFDLRGHGLSGGKRGHSGSYEILMEDITQWLEAAKNYCPETPIFLYGHSMGGNLVLNYALRKNPRVRGIIASSPWLELVSPPNGFMRVISKMMAKIVPSIAFSNKLNTSDLYRLEEIRRMHDEDPLVHDRISAGLFDMVTKSGEFALEKAMNLDYPALLIHGGNDRIISWKATSIFADKTPEGEFHLFDECYHEIHNEPECSDALGLIAQWIESKITRPMPRKKIDRA